ncbi:MAG: lipid-A-disaccharide synthase [Prevotella sp.]|uniref:lipid-A-disaccharide synthase n=1 Tax=Prevotella sp. TaxID=59823 RepID=UPI002A2DB21C|nr:lipid-A-disaccharide synthase [Prevotella sp.]MDD7317953.1 lipid-A-disaccharide synthase [Prevotellaceae bacterium]MDY4020427.1 lipid-A-disaccharide synthase [Prevotella sp.]
MKYYIIVGEASGDLHASHLMQALCERDPEADFRFLGGDLMTRVGGTRVRHYRDMAYMGFAPVLMHLRTISKNMKMCRRDVLDWNPDVLILVDYPGFNLSIAKYVHRHSDIPIYYYISPKLWAWKEYRIKNIRRDIDEMFSILPFERDFFEKKHNYPIHYVGNPTSAEVNAFRIGCRETPAEFRARHGLDERPIIALLAGSRRQEIKDNLPAMLLAASEHSQDYNIVLAGAPGIEREYYDKFICDCDIRIVDNDTFALLFNAVAALVTSGTATLETALFRVPQVVCYETPLPYIIGYLRKKVIKVPYVSLVNLIAGEEVVPELVADTFTKDKISAHLRSILPGGDAREAMLRGYERVDEALGHSNAPEEAARIMLSLLRKDA